MTYLIEAHPAGGQTVHTCCIFAVLAVSLLRAKNSTVSHAGRTTDPSDSLIAGARSCIAKDQLNHQLFLLVRDYVRRFG
jgi:hypothetical protein